MASPTANVTAGPSPTTSPTPLASGDGRTLTSDDGQLSVQVSPGAAEDPSGLMATARGEDDLPPELAGLEVRSAFYELTPAGVQFGAPVTITRRVSFRDLDLDPAEGVPILLLAMRSADAAWTWLSEQTLQRVGDEVVVTGQAMYTGSVFAFGGVASTDVDITGDGPIPVGSALRISATLEFPDVARDPPLMGAIEPVFDEAFVDIGDAVGPDGRNVSQDFVCTGAGSATVGFLYSVVNVGADSPLFDQLGLQPASTRVAATTQLTCAAAGATSPDPSAPASSPVSSP